MSRGLITCGVLIQCVVYEAVPSAFMCVVLTVVLCVLVVVCLSRVACLYSE